MLVGNGSPYEPAQSSSQLNELAARCGVHPLTAEKRTFDKD